MALADAISKDTTTNRKREAAAGFFFYPAYFAKRWSCISVILLYQTDNGQSLLLLVCAPEWLMSLYRDNSNINGMRWLLLLQQLLLSICIK
jgi:hypothetical protein